MLLCLLGWSHDKISISIIDVSSIAVIIIITSMMLWLCSSMTTPVAVCIASTMLCFRSGSLRHFSMSTSRTLLSPAGMMVHSLVHGDISGVVQYGRQCLQFTSDRSRVRTSSQLTPYTVESTQAKLIAATAQQKSTLSVNGTCLEFLGY